MAITWQATVGNVFLFFLIYGMSATVDFSHFRKQLQNKKGIGIGLFLQFIVLPLLGFLVIKILELEKIYGITLLIITSSPGGAYSNWFCSMFNGDLALSVTMTAISTILSIGMLPLNVYVYMKASYGDDILDTLDWNSLGISLAVVITAISIGLFCSYWFDTPTFRNVANKLGNLSGLGLIIFSFLAPEGGRVEIGGRPLLFYLATPLPIVLGMICSVIISTIVAMKKPERVSVTVECCYQNTGIAITSCLSLFRNEEQRTALGVPFFYTGMQTLIVGCFCLLAWKLGWSKCPSKKNIIEMLLKNYQDQDNTDVNDDENNNEQKQSNSEEEVI